MRSRVLAIAVLCAASACAANDPDALLSAAYHDDLDRARQLIAAGAAPNAANDLGATPLWAAAQNGSAAMTAELLRAGANPDAALLAGETPLMIASRGGFAPVVEQLLAKRANPNAKGARGQTALMWAAANKRAGVVNLLLAAGADVHALTETWSKTMAVPPHGYLPYNKDVPHGAYTALLFAARVGDLESAKLLIEAGSNVNQEDAWGVTPLVLAAHSGFTDLAVFLLRSGANPNAAKAGFTAMHAAILRREERLVRELLEFGADPNAPLQTWTPTRRSSRDWNFDPKLVGATPLWLAARFLQPETMRLLARRGANGRVVHESHFVVEKKGYVEKSESVTTLMAALGAGGGSAWIQPSPEERAGLTLETVKAALELGADIHAANSSGHTALDLARAQKLSAAADLLTSRGARPGQLPAASNPQ